MVDITGKPDVYREAAASGVIRLKPETVRRILEGRVEKGDVLTCARLAAIMAVKRTPEILFLTHPIPITGVDVSFEFGEDWVKARVTVRSHGKTGVEMEALTGVSAALLTVFDMCKAYEKDEMGQYPVAEITDIRVERKVKGEA